MPTAHPESTLPPLHHAARGRVPGAALSLSNVSKSFDGFPALREANLAVQRGQVHALLGENGAGKSTLMNIAFGLYAPDQGQIAIDGVPTHLSGPQAARLAGVGMVHQHFKIVPQFSVLENILLFNPTGQAESQPQTRSELIRRVYALSDRMGFSFDLSIQASALSVAEQQQLEILKVMVAGAQTIIMDEPTAVLTDRDAARLMELIRALAEDGAAIILVTHKLHEALDHCDGITVMRSGRTAAHLTPDETDRQALTRLIVGQAVTEQPEPAQNVGDIALSLSNIVVKGAENRQGLTGACFNVRSGEIYGVAGVSGNGQTELANAIAGTQQPEAGQIEIEGKIDAGSDSPKQRRRRGFAWISEDRYRDGLTSRISVLENYAVQGVLSGKFGSWGWINRASARRAAQQALTEFDVQGVHRLDQPAGLLSGGNAQKLVIAREFSESPKIVLAHSPSRGLDVRAAAAVHDRLRRARNGGAAVILISDDLDEVMLLADRIGVLNRGRITAEFDTPADRQAIGRAMLQSTQVTGGHADV